MGAVACKPQNSADIVIASHHVGETVTDSCLFFHSLLTLMLLWFTALSDSHLL